VSSAEAARRTLRRWWRKAIAPSVIVAAILVANAAYLTSYSDPNPLATRSALATSITKGRLPGERTLDPNDGYVTQAIGRQAAHQIVDGHVPFWNPYDAVGTPLLASPQSAALFPPTLLNLFDNGLFYELLLLEAIAGITTFLLVRRLGLGQLAAVMAGVAFGLNGTFGWLQNGAMLPVAFLPAMLLGVELAADRAAKRRAGGWAFLAVSVVFALCSGWLETLYLFALFAAGWTIVRTVVLPREVRVRFLQKVGAGVVCGALLAAPFLIPMLSWLRAADLGGHASGFSDMTLPGAAVPTVTGLPYALGPLFAFNDPQGTVSSVWSNVGGFLSASLVVLAIIGACGRSRRPLRLLLVATIAVCIVKTFGPHLVVDAFNLLPGMSSVAFYRYMPPTLEFSAVLLCAFAIDDIGARRVTRRVLAGAAVGAVALFGLAVLLAHSVASDAGATRYLVRSLVWALVVLAVILVASLLAIRGLRYATWFVVATVIVDVTVAYALPTLSAPREVTIDTSSVHWLERHLGSDRFFTFYPIAANYGSYFDVASLASTNAPVPKRWADSLRAALGDDVDPNVFANVASSLVAVAENPGFLRRAAVRYVLLAPQGTMGDPLGPHLHLVHRDAAAAIYRLDGARPYFDVPDGCRVRSHGRERAVVTCDRPSRIVRREFFDPGWSATVDGRSVSVRTHGRLYQAVDVPAGTSTIVFAYAPEHWSLAVAAFVVGLLWLGLAPVFVRARAARAERVPDAPVAEAGAP
jgi:hypothetical protein